MSGYFIMRSEWLLADECRRTYRDLRSFSVRMKVFTQIHRKKKFLTPSGHQFG
jgi:hypothetical protein